MNIVIRFGMWIARVGGWQPAPLASLTQLSDELRGIMRNDVPSMVSSLAQELRGILNTDLPIQVANLVHEQVQDIYDSELQHVMEEQAKWSVKAHVWPSDLLVGRARVLTDEVELPGFSGEHKRHQVLARLTKEYPGESTRTLAMAIELALAT